MKKTARLLIFASLLVTGTARAHAETVDLSSLDLSKASTAWGTVKANLSIGQQPMSIGGTKFTNGVGIHAYGVMRVKLDGGSNHFHCVCGVDDETNGSGSLIFRVVSEQGTLFKSPVMHGNDKGIVVDLDVAGVKMLALLVSAGQPTDNEMPFVAFDHADWADATFEVTGTRPQLVGVDDDRTVLTPPPGPKPRINGPKIYAARPGHPFLYLIPCTGQRPIKFSATNLPASLTLDTNTGIITGKTPESGTYTVTLDAVNALGSTTRAFQIVAGDTLSLTPPMGFNSWYACFDQVSDEKMRQAADLMVSSGMADAGYQFVDLDDGWAGDRDANGKIRGDANFPNMKALVDFIHAKGLKAGIYSSPDEKTISYRAGSFQHEADDAAQFAAWGFDSLKYERWYYDAEKAGVEGNQKAFKLMGDLLRQQPRDIGFNISLYGNADVWKWGCGVGAQSWRTGGDISRELPRFFDVARHNIELGAWNGPGGWNDPDFVQIGWSQEFSALGENNQCPLTPAEQYAFMSLWCLMPAPLFFSGDMAHLDPFTLGILCNPEVIEVDQDVLGKSARLVPIDEDRFLLIKDLEDGSKAVGLFNQGEIDMEVTAKWNDLGVTSKQALRDLWREKDLGTFEDSFTAVVPRHGVALLKFESR